MNKIFLVAEYFLVFTFFTCCQNVQDVENNKQNDPILHPSVTIKYNVQRDKPFKKGTYFLINGISEGNEQALIDSLNANRVRINSLWVPYTYYDCMGVVPSQVIVQLDNLDDKIKIYGFTTDSIGIGYCVKSWKEYVFNY